MTRGQNAYMDNSIVIKRAKSGPLDGLSFSVKDVFEVKGHTNSAGNPDWLRTHEKASSHSPVIEKLLNNGAIMKGITITDELMYSLDGINAHYGTPRNPKAPNHIPGGSSSGSAVSVASGDVDFSIGTDTGGSMRIPASYCGIYGFRPSHGIISTAGCIPMAKSFDTVGWMARNPDVLRKVGQVFLGKRQLNSKPFTTIYFPEQIWNSLLDKSIVEILKGKTNALLSNQFQETFINWQKAGFSQWPEIFRVIQGYEVWQEHGDWVERVNPSFGPGISDRMKMAATITEFEMKQAWKKRTVIEQMITNLLQEDSLLIIPTAVQGPPSLQSSQEELKQIRSKNLQLTCIASLCGLPQLSIPLFEYKGCPIGLSFVANRREDLRLLKLGEELANQ